MNCVQLPKETQTDHLKKLRRRTPKMHLNSDDLDRLKKNKMTF